MSRLNRIQNEIKQLEGGKFQQLCDKYIYIKMNWENIVSLGSMEGTDKTTIGNPDSYNFSDQVERYTFIMSGTRKDSTAKLESDIKDAITKTKVDKKSIQEIICCHTSSNLSVKKDNELRELAKPAKLTLIGIDTLAQDLLKFRYQDVVREYLGIAETTEQVWSIKQFIEIHDKSKTNAPLNIKYIDDRNIIHTSIDKLNDSQILLLSGAPGAGKTKLAIEICKCLSVDSNVICVKSNSLPVYQDIKDALENDRPNYLFLDDANTITNFSAIINLLKLKEYEQNLKVILTVREYAIFEISFLLQSFETRVEKVPLMDDIKLGMLIKRVLSEINTNAINKIMKLAHNNPRIAVLAAMMENRNSDFFENSKGILDIYYNQILKENSISKNEKVTLFILSFMNKVDLENHELLNELLSFFRLDVAVFIDAVTHLHEKELCDIFQSRIAQVSDQSLSDFVLIDFISNRQIFKIRNFFSKLYPTYANEITEMLAHIDGYDSSKEWSEYLANELKYVNFATIKEENREEFLIRFGAFVPTEAFAYVFRKIQEEEVIKYNVSQSEFQTKKGNDEIINPIIQILSLLSRNGRFNDAGKLLVEYLIKRQDRVFEIFAAIKVNFDVEYDWDDYLVKRISIFETFSNQKNIEELTALLIVNVAEEFLKLSEEKSISNVAIPCSHYRLLRDEKYLSLQHKKIFETLFKIHCFDYKEVNNAIDRLLINYPVDEIKNFFVETVVSDLKCIGNLFFEDITKLTNRQESILSKLQTEINKYELRISPFLEYEMSNKQKVYRIFSTDEYSSEMKDLNYSDSREMRVKMLKGVFTEFSKDFEELFNILSEYQSDEVLNNSELEESIFLHYSIVEKKEKVKILIGLLNSDFLTSYSPSQYMNQLSFEDGRNVLSRIQKEVDVRWSISNMLTCEIIEQEQVAEMTLLLENIKENEVFESFDILSFDCYINEDSSILELFWKYFNEEIISNKFFIPEGQNERVFERIIKIVGIEKLEKVYLKSLETEGMDYSGRLFKNLLIEQGVNFAYAFLLKLHSLEFFSDIHEYHNHLKYLWNLKDIEKAINLYLDFLIKENSLIYYGLDYALKLLIIENFEGFMEFIIDEIFKTNDESRIVNLYNIVLEIYDIETLFVLFQILKEKKISDDSFKKINLTRNIGEYSGSFAPTIEKNIRLLNSLLLVFEDIEYISYSYIIDEYIEYLKLFKESILITDLLE